MPCEDKMHPIYTVSSQKVPQIDLNGVLGGIKWQGAKIRAPIDEKCVAD